MLGHILKGKADPYEGIRADDSIVRIPAELQRRPDAQGRDMYLLSSNNVVPMIPRWDGKPVGTMEWYHPESKRLVAHNGNHFEEITNLPDLLVQMTHIMYDAYELGKPIPWDGSFGLQLVGEPTDFYEGEASLALLVHAPSVH